VRDGTCSSPRRMKRVPGVGLIEKVGPFSHIRSMCAKWAAGIGRPINIFIIINYKGQRKGK
jgi:hypothetical protein